MGRVNPLQGWASLVAHARPALENALVAGDPVRIVGGEGHAGLNIHHQFRIVGKAEGDAVHVLIRGYINLFQGLAARGRELHRSGRPTCTTPSKPQRQHKARR